MVREALRLEREAEARYTEHPAASSDPRLVTYWESLRRNEAEHRARLEAWLRDHGEDPEADAPAGEGPGRGRAGPRRRRPAPADAHRATAAAATPATSRPCARTTTWRTRPSSVYGHFAYQAEDRELTELFKELARSESGHRNGLRRTIRTVEDPATPVVLFCPLCGWQIDFGPDPAEGTEGKCPVCPGRFALRLGRGRRLDPGEAGTLR